MNATARGAPNVTLALGSPRRETAARVQEVAENVRLRHVLTQVYPTYVVNVSRPFTPWSWTSVLLAPIEFLVLALSVPALILLLIVPIGLALASALWIGRFILRL